MTILLAAIAIMNVFDTDAQGLYYESLNKVAEDQNQFKCQVQEILRYGESIFPKFKEAIASIHSLSVGRSDKAQHRNDLSEVLGEMDMAATNQYIYYYLGSRMHNHEAIWHTIISIRQLWNMMKTTDSFKANHLIYELVETKLADKLPALWQFLADYGTARKVNSRQTCDRKNIELTAKFLADIAAKAYLLNQWYESLRSGNTSADTEYTYHTYFLAEASSHCYNDMRMFAEKDIIDLLQPKFGYSVIQFSKYTLQETIEMVRSRIVRRYDWMSWTLIAISDKLPLTNQAFHYASPDTPPLHFYKFPTKKGIPTMNLVAVYTKHQYLQITRPVKMQLCPKLISNDGLSVSILWWDALHYAQCIEEQLSKYFVVKFIHVYKCLCPALNNNNCQDCDSVNVVDRYVVAGCVFEGSPMMADVHCNVLRIPQKVYLSVSTYIDFVLFIVVVK